MENQLLLNNFLETVIEPDEEKINYYGEDEINFINDKELKIINIEEIDL